MLHTAYFDVSVLPEISDLTAFTQYRREKIVHLKRKTDWQLSAGAELLLKELLADCGFTLTADTFFNVNDNGKPYIPETKLEFNLSHSGNFCACAVSDKAVGIDIEKISPYRETVARRYFSPGEQQEIHAANNRNIVFTRLWTEKEACIKQQGSTLGKMLPLMAQTGTLLYCNRRSLELSTWLVGDYSIAVCSTEISDTEPADLTLQILSHMNLNF